MNVMEHISKLKIVPVVVIKELADAEPTLRALQNGGLGVAEITFRTACANMGAEPQNMGDIGHRLQIFPDLPMCLKFYFGDEEFPPQLTLLWDKNTLRFVRYETVYYIAGCLQKRLLELIKQ